MKRFFCCLLGIILSLGTTACDAKKSEPFSQGDVCVNENDWIIQTGDWKFFPLLISQTEKGKNKRLLYCKAIDQTWLNLQYEVRADSRESIASIEFRAANAAKPEMSLCYTYPRISLDFQRQKFLLEIPEMQYKASYGTSLNLDCKKWYKIKIELNGSNGRFYLNDRLITERADITYGSFLPTTDPYYQGEYDKIALVANDKVDFRNIHIDNSIQNPVSYADVIKSGNIEKKGFDRYASKAFEYCYYGLGRTSVYAGPNGFLFPDAPKNNMATTYYRYEPMLVYDLWWRGQHKVDPFLYRGGYLCDNELNDGEINLKNKNDCYEQILDISSGALMTKLDLIVAGEEFSTTRESFVTTNGIVAYKVLSNSKKPFAFEITEGTNIYSVGFSIERTARGLLFWTDLQDCNGNDKKGWLYLSYMGGNDVSVEIDEKKGRVIFPASESPIYLYLSPSSELDVSENGEARANAIMRGENAKDKGYESLFSETKAWWDAMYARSSIEIPDLGMAKWYVRSLYYNAVSMAFSRVPPGCYATNVNAFLGQPCYEFDLMYSQLALMTANQTDISATTIDWVKSILNHSRELARTGTDNAGDYYYEGDGEAFLFTSLMAYDGTPVNTEGLYESWKSTWTGTTVAQSMLMQAEYTDDEKLRELALRVVEGQGRLHLSHFIDNPYFSESGLLHPSVSAPGDIAQNAAAIWTIETLKKYGKDIVFSDRKGRPIDVNNIILRKKDKDGHLYGTLHDDRIGGDVLSNNIRVQYGSTRNNPTGPVISSSFNWLPVFNRDDFVAYPTLVDMAECGLLDYNFNRGWVATVADRLHCGNIAYELAQGFTAPNVVNDDSYFCENIHDTEDYERTPELGAHSSFMMSVQEMLLQGANDQEIWVFPSLPSCFEKTGVAFDNLLAFGNLAVSAKYSKEATDVKIENRGNHDISRKIYVGINSGATVANVNGRSYPITEGRFAEVSISLSPGTNIELHIVGETKHAPSTFDVCMPSIDSKGIRNENIVFAWTPSDGAEYYQLMISENSDMSNPIFNKNVGNTILYYSATKVLLHLEPNKTYYYKIGAVNSKGKTSFEREIGKFSTYYMHEDYIKKK